MIETILILVACHLIGDYVLQSNYLAMNKGKNWYEMFVHCFLYCIPFYFVFGYRIKSIYVRQLAKQIRREAIGT